MRFVIPRPHYLLLTSWAVQACPSLRPALSTAFAWLHRTVPCKVLCCSHPLGKLPLHL